MGVSDTQTFAVYGPARYLSPPPIAEGPCNPFLPKLTCHLTVTPTRTERGKPVSVLAATQSKRAGRSSGRAGWARGKAPPSSPASVAPDWPTLGPADACVRHGGGADGGNSDGVSCHFLSLFAFCSHSSARRPLLGSLFLGELAGRTREGGWWLQEGRVGG